MFDLHAPDAEIFANYRALIAKVDVKVGEIAAARAADVNCRKGCHSCCLPGLTVNGVERAYLAAHVAATPGCADELAALAARDPHAGKRCAFLADDGACAVYAARPIVCRSHGMPLELKTKKRDVCPLNFTASPLATIDAQHVLNLELMNTLLALIDGKYTGDAGEKAARHPLTPAGLAAKSNA